MHNTMKPIVLAILGAFILLLLFSCSTKQNEDITQSVNKEGAIESAVQVEHVDSLHDVLITTHTIWTNNQEVKTIQYRDTIPGLGSHIAVAENTDGETKNVSVKKEYEIFITVK